MIYTTPWEPGFDTHKVLAKKMAVWLDLVNVDPMIEEVGRELLGTLGTVLQLIGTTESNDSKFGNIQGCVLMDLTRPLLTMLRMFMNNTKKQIKIRYDTLPDAYYKCQERGHFARNYTKGKEKPDKDKAGMETTQNKEDFTQITRKGNAGGLAAGALADHEIEEEKMEAPTEVATEQTTAESAEEESLPTCMASSGGHAQAPNQSDPQVLDLNSSPADLEV
ncbi:hypothetical protein R1sor_014932 [Riccia sorocarpa]|uniref:Uncharacterized protein n=1 Tax=Riccia sorocarpa TaxID=122646 RepID=A0ABD3HAS6_9MARC